MLDSSIAAYTSEEALKFGIGREAQDEWALRSHERYFAAEKASYFNSERRTISISDNGAQTLVSRDESPREETSIDLLRKLPQVGGSKTITAGNAPGLNDGAASLVLTSRERAAKCNWPVAATLLDYVQISGTPTSGSYTPALGIEKLLKRNHVSLDDLDLLEINEAFAATALVSTLQLADQDPKEAERLRTRTNVHGGAIAIGHPLGASGARLIMTLINGLHRRGGGLGAAAICGGFGQGDAILLSVTQ
jgi:acetyl-CoA C-acetyltransferase